MQVGISSRANSAFLAYKWFWVLVLSRLCPRKPWWPEVDNDEVTIAAEEAPQEMVGVARGRHNGREGPRRDADITMMSSRCCSFTHQHTNLHAYLDIQGKMVTCKSQNGPTIHKQINMWHVNLFIICTIYLRNRAFIMDQFSNICGPLIAISWILWNISSFSNLHDFEKVRSGRCYNFA